MWSRSTTAARTWAFRSIAAASRTASSPATGIMPVSICAAARPSISGQTTCRYARFASSTARYGWRPRRRRATEAAHWRQRLHDGLAHNISLVIGKAVLGATAAGVPATELVRDALLYGASPSRSLGRRAHHAYGRRRPARRCSTRTTASSRCFTASSRSPTTARESRRASTASRWEEMYRSRRWRAGSATGCGCATAPARSAPCAPRSPQARPRNGSRPPP